MAFLIYIAQLKTSTMVAVLGVSLIITILIHLRSQRLKKEAATAPAVAPTEEAKPTPAPAPIAQVEIKVAPVPPVPSPVMQVPVASVDNDPIALDKLKHALVIVNAEKDKALIRCSGLQAQIEEKDRQSQLLTLKNTELEKHVTELQRVLRDINDEVKQLKQSDAPKPEVQNLINLVFGNDENQKHDPAQNTVADEPTMHKKVA